MRFKIKLVRLRFWLRIWRSHVLADTSSPFVDSSARLQIGLSIITALLVLPYQDKSLPYELLSTLPNKQTLFLVFAVFIVTNTLIATLFVTSSINKIGHWDRHQFIYHTPKHVHTLVATDADNGKLFGFKIPEAEVGGAADLSISTDGFGKNEVRVQFVFLPTFGPIWDEYERRSGLLHIFNDRKCWLATLKPVPSNASTIKVHMNSWYGRVNKQIDRPK